MENEERVIYSSQTYIDDDTDLNFDILEFQDEGGLIIQHNISVSAQIVVTDEAMNDIPRFTFTTLKPEIRPEDGSDEPNEKKSAKLIIKDLQSSIKIVNVGKPGANGANGGIGGNGGNGSKGGIGGDGGIGFDGGKGGSGPDLIINYETYNQSLITPELKKTRGGNGGKGGAGGKGGKNSDGSFAPDGKNGNDGNTGAEGEKGRVRINGEMV